MATFSRLDDFKAWEKAKGLVSKIYRLSNGRTFAMDKTLQNQIRRASISIVSNIGEGFERDGSTEFLHFLSMAKGSIGEVRTQLHIAFEVGHVGEADFKEVDTDVIVLGKMVGSLMNYLRASNLRGKKFARR